MKIKAIVKEKKNSEVEKHSIQYNLNAVFFIVYNLSFITLNIQIKKYQSTPKNLSKYRKYIMISKIIGLRYYLYFVQNKYFIMEKLINRNR